MKISTKEGQKFIQISQKHLDFLASEAVKKKITAEALLSKYLDQIIYNDGTVIKQRVPAVKQRQPLPPSGKVPVTPSGDRITATREQCHAIDLVVNQKKSVIINAYAGTGKTTLLHMIAEQLADKQVLYITFNRKNADEAAKRFPRNVKCYTGHMLALRSMGNLFANRLKRRLTGFDLATKMNFSPLPGITKNITGEMVLATINGFCYSADRIIEGHHVPSEYMDFFKDDIEKKFNRQVICQYAQDCWEMLIKPDEQLPVTHDLYLKLWALSNPQLKVDSILVDEAQDCNPVILQTILNQENVQKIFSGDSHQSVYGWRGAVNAMDSVHLDDSCVITQSFRYGQVIADIGSKILNKTFDTNIKIKGCPSISSELTTNPCRTILCRTNLRLIDRAMKIYRQNHKIRIHIVGRSKSAGQQDELSALLNGAHDLMNNNRTTVPELRSFANWNEVVNYSQTEAGKHMTPLIQMVSMWPIRKLQDTLQRIGSTTPEMADVTLSTVHRAKGMEWPEVELENDFRKPGSNNYNPEEAHLLYVAVTRASQKLNIFNCEACDDLY